MNKEYEIWKLKRTRTILVFIWLKFLDNVDYSLTATSALPNLQYNVHASNVNLSFALVITSRYLSSAVAGILTAKYLDRTRRTKRALSVLLVLQVIGYGLYIIPYSTFFPIVGKLLSGIGESYTSTFASEIIRICDVERSNRFLWWLSSASGVGIAFGPLFLLPLQNADFNIGPINVNKYNIAGLLMAIICCFNLILRQIFVYDCSRKLDLKERMAKLGIKNENAFESFITGNQICPINLQKKEQEENGLENGKLINTFQGSNDVRRNFDVYFIQVSAFISTYIIASMDVLLPLISYTVFMWSFRKYIVVTTLYGASMIVVYIILGKVCTSHTSLYFLGLVAMLFGMLFFLSLQVATSFGRNTIIDDVVMSVLVICIILMWAFEMTVQRSLLGGLVPSAIQGTVEAERNAAARFGIALGSLVTPLFMTVLSPVSLITMAILYILVAIYVLRRETLSNPLVENQCE